MPRRLNSMLGCILLALPAKAATIMNFLAPMTRILPPAVINRLRETRNALLFYLESLASVEQSVLRRALQDLGLRPGDLVFIHSSYDQMRSIRATPLEIIEILCEAVGDSGTVVMPTFPMSGLSQDYLDHHPFFDWRRTPSRSGILTEIFRRMPGTERSLHPTHPVAARGAAAMWLTEGHDRSETPFDEYSPFQRLQQCNAFILSIGRFDAMTFRHLADHLIQDKVVYPIYADRLTTVRMIGKRGEEHRILTKAHNPDIACDHQVVLDRMAREGLLRTAKVGRVPLSLFRLQQYMDAYQRYYSLGLFRHYLKSQQVTPASDR